MIKITTNTLMLIMMIMLVVLILMMNLMMTVMMLLLVMVLVWWCWWWLWHVGPPEHLGTCQAHWGPRQTRSPHRTSTLSPSWKNTSLGNCVNNYIFSNKHQRVTSIYILQNHVHTKMLIEDYLVRLDQQTFLHWKEEIKKVNFCKSIHQRDSNIFVASAFFPINVYRKSIIGFWAIWNTWEKYL